MSKEKNILLNKGIILGCLGENAGVTYLNFGNLEKQDIWIVAYRVVLKLLRQRLNLRSWGCTQKQPSA